MIGALLALVLTSPAPVAPLIRCASSCRERGAVWACVYDLQRACEVDQFVCPVRADVLCVPRVVNLGTWDPRPAPSDSMTTYTFSPPRDSSLPLMGP